jgi:hypothetical protein
LAREGKLWKMVERPGGVGRGEGIATGHRKYRARLEMGPPEVV